MLSTAFAIDWDAIISETAPRLDPDRTIGHLIGGGLNTSSRFPGLTLFIFFFAGLALLLYLLYGGLILLTSGGEPKKVESGKQIITNAFIGFLIIFTAYWLVQIISFFLGLAGFGNVF